MRRRGALHAAFAILATCILACGCGSNNESVDAPPITRPDAPPPTAQFGDACNAHGDCISNYCVEAVGGVGGVCTRPCTEGCPSDWACRSVTIEGTATDLCVPNAPQLCLACASDTECGSNAACITLDGTNSCATKCSGATCPLGYQCVTDPTGTHAGTYCQPVTGSCSCSAALEGATRACTNPNAIGTCYGVQTCAAATGWSACSAATATAESCDGIDNDCDFLTDESVGGGQACAITNSFGTCPGTQTCTGATGFKCTGQTPVAEMCNYADDNCNGAVDEAFPTLGSLCSPGVGACQRFGSVRCNTGGTGVECSVVAGTPGTEACNAADDDCDSKVDETFPTLGSSCSSGQGICARYGTTICNGTGTATMCSATAGTNSTTETCNYLDDDCDGTVDDGFRNAGTGVYDQTANCGGCGNNCATVFTGANATGACSTASGSPQCAMVCNTGTFNLNNSTADGCEFVLDATTIYVSTTDAAAVDDATCGLGPANTGGTNHPCKTITYGLGRAASASRANVRVADGTYSEAVTLASNINLYGGYSADTWVRHLATTSTVIQGVSSAGVHDRTVIATNVSNSIFEGFVVRGSFNTKASGNSYAIYVSGGTATLTIRNNQIFGGRGGPGTSGTPGTNGSGGGNGTGSVNGSYDAFIVSGTATQCDATNNRQYTNGGTNTCGGNSVNGGNGGGNKCPPASDYTQASGVTGFAGATSGGGAAGTGGQGGYDGTLTITATDTTCFLPAQPMQGADGNAGGAGSNGTAGSGCSTTNGSIVLGHWVNGSATAGSAGTDGGGGGGGGAGGGGRCTSCVTPIKDRLGAHGGGGGAGGCGGTPGAAGAPGGGVFGIFIVGGAAPVLTNNTVARGAGGSAGDGGIGGAGGLGGSGAVGGTGLTLCAARAGKGGDGGNGGSGSGGGGGCGGSSFGIFTSGIGSPTYCSSNTVSGGSPGLGGEGGFSGGNSGTNGADGTLAACTSI